MTDTPSLLSQSELKAFVAGNSMLRAFVKNGLVSRTMKGEDLAVFVRNIEKTGKQVLDALEERRKELGGIRPLTFPMWVVEFATIVRGVESNLRRGPAEDPEEFDDGGGASRYPDARSGWEDWSNY